jgi:hypothetical protein
MRTSCNEWRAGLSHAGTTVVAVWLLFSGCTSEESGNVSVEEFFPSVGVYLVVVAGGLALGDASLST